MGLSDRETSSRVLSPNLITAMKDLEFIFWAKQETIRQSGLASQKRSANLP